MIWFTASLITTIKVIDEEQDTIPVFEDFFLIEAIDREEAIREAKRIGKEHESIDDKLFLNGKPAKRIFMGIRKIRSVYNTAPSDIDFERPGNGTELTHSYYEVRNFNDAEKLANGESVNILYIDDNN